MNCRILVADVVKTKDSVESTIEEMKKAILGMDLGRFNFYSVENDIIEVEVIYSIYSTRYQRLYKKYLNEERLNQLSDNQIIYIYDSLKGLDELRVKRYRDSRYSKLVSSNYYSTLHKELLLYLADSNLKDTVTRKEVKRVFQTF